MKLYKLLGLVTLLAIVRPVKAQELRIDNILWGSAESNRVFIGVPNEFYINSYIHSSLKALFPENPEEEVEIGDTLHIRPIKPGAYPVLIIADGVKHELVFEADYLPPVFPEIEFVMQNGKVFEGTQIKLSSPDSIFDGYSVAECILLVGDKKFTVNTNILPIEIINEINLLPSGTGVTIESCRLQNVNLKQVDIAARKTYFPNRDN